MLLRQRLTCVKGAGSEADLGIVLLCFFAFYNPSASFLGTALYTREAVFYLFFGLSRSYKSDIPKRFIKGIGRFEEEATLFKARDVLTYVER